MQKSARYIRPGQLAKDRGCVQKIPTVANGPKRTHAEEQEASLNFHHRRIDGCLAHTLFVHYREDKWEENDFTEKSSFLDILHICNMFVDINSVGIKVRDGNGKELRNDKDLLTLLGEQADVENIELYMDMDKTAQPLLFKLPQVMLPQDNPGAASVPCISQVSHANTRDGQATDPRPKITEENVEDAQKERKVRGNNKNTKIARLKAGQKLEIRFYNNRGVGTNHTFWSRHLGKIVRDKNISLIQVKTWKDVTEPQKEHKWASVKECFSDPNIELYRGHTLAHMDNLWTAWKSSLNVKYVKPCKTKAEVLKNVPKGMNAKDWEWLVINKFLTDEFQTKSAQNSTDRVN